MFDLQYFMEFMDKFRKDPLFQDMLQCEELTKWHREPNVGTHTNMVVAEYCNLIDTKWGKDEVIGAMACAFHDTGKPKSKEMKYSEERGDYPSFHGHELDSTRLLENYMVSNWWLLGHRYDPIDIYKIGWMIQNHLPYKIKKPNKLIPIKVTAERLFGNLDTFSNVLLADQWGRISDTQDENRQKVVDWIDQLTELSVRNTLGPVDPDKPTLYVMIAPSSAGKSTVVKSLAKEHDCSVFSYDELRYKWYDPETRDYDVAWKRSIEDSTFNSRSQRYFLDMLQSTGHRNIIADNMHLTQKSRNFIGFEAIKRGYNVIAVLVPISLQELIDRSVARADRSIPIPSIINMYNKLQYPSIGINFHDVIVSRNNLHVTGNRIKLK